MPDLENATTVRKQKRGFRRLTMTLRSREYERLAEIADRESRSPDQQAAYMLRGLLEDRGSSNGPLADVEADMEGEA